VSDRTSVPEAAQELHLFLDAPTPGGEVLPEGLVLDGIPPETHAQPESAFGQQVDLSSLLGHQRGLTLGQDDDAGHQLEPGESGQMAEEHEGLTKRAVDVVGTGPARVEGAVGAEHVVVGQDVGVAQLLDALHVGPDRTAVDGQLGLREHHSDAHALFLPASRLSTRAPVAEHPRTAGLPGLRPRR
jgi:hypothetical protein